MEDSCTLCLATPHWRMYYLLLHQSFMTLLLFMHIGLYVCDLTCFFQRVAFVHAFYVRVRVAYRIALFRGSLISRIWNLSRNLFNENLSHCAVTPMGNTNSRNLFNEFLQSSYSRKFRPAKYKRYTVCA